MPCPHNEITIVQRSQRQSAVAAAAYQSGEKLFCEYDQQVKHYPEKRGIVHNEILLPANAPQEYADRNTLRLPLPPEAGLRAGQQTAGRRPDCRGRQRGRAGAEHLLYRQGACRGQRGPAGQRGVQRPGEGPGSVPGLRGGAGQADPHRLQLGRAEPCVPHPVRAGGLRHAADGGGEAVRPGDPAGRHRPA